MFNDMESQNVMATFQQLQINVNESRALSDLHQAVNIRLQEENKKLQQENEDLQSTLDSIRPTIIAMSCEQISILEDNERKLQAILDDIQVVAIKPLLAEMNRLRAELDDVNNTLQLMLFE